MAKILLVEDDRQISGHLSEILKAEGYGIRAAYGQREALERMEQENFDLVLLDVGLPDGNGFSLCAAIRETHRIPIIFLTASGDEYSVVAGLDMGADDYIAKPFRPPGADIPD